MPKRIKKEISWYVALVYLDGLRGNALNLFNDPEYKRRFNELYDYVGDKLDPPPNYEIVDSYIIVEQEKAGVGRKR